MENRLEQPPSDDPTKHVHELAYDLAYGALQGYWRETIGVTIMDGEDQWLSFSKQHKGGEINPLYKYLRDKWAFKQPSADLLASFGYFHKPISVNRFQREYTLGPKAFDLLASNQGTTDIFISYKQSESSELAFAVATALELAAPTLSVFTDKDTPLGEDWKEGHRKRVQECSFFICLLTLETLTSDDVRNEIVWALEAGCTIITICHRGYKFSTLFPPQRADDQVIKQDLVEELSSRHAIFIEKDGVSEYADKMRRLVERITGKS